MKKILGIIVLVGLLVLIGFGFTYKMVEPDGWDRVVETVVEKVPVLENIISEKTPEPQPTPATPTPEVTVVPDTEGNSNTSHSNEESNTAEPSSTPAPTATPDASATPSPTPEVDFENMTYEVYHQLPAAIQEEYFRTYEDPMEFIQWYNASKEEYDRLHPSIEIDGSIDLGDYVN